MHIWCFAYTRQKTHRITRMGGSQALPSAHDLFRLSVVIFVCWGRLDYLALFTLLQRLFFFVFVSHDYADVSPSIPSHRHFFPVWTSLAALSGFSFHVFQWVYLGLTIRASHSWVVIIQDLAEI